LKRSQIALKPDRSRISPVIELKFSIYTVFETFLHNSKPIIPESRLTFNNFASGLNEPCRKKQPGGDIAGGFLRLISAFISRGYDFKASGYFSEVNLLPEDFTD
jgi:hypothetical protein